jgi:hypothetical protein
MWVVLIFQGVDEMYDAALSEFFTPYHMLVDLICRVAVNHQSLSEPIINLSTYPQPTVRFVESVDHSKVLISTVGFLQVF